MNTFDIFEHFSKNNDIIFTNNDATVDTRKKTRVMFCGTYPIGQSNGYSRVVYYIAKFLGAKDDIALTIYGFQNFNNNTKSTERNGIPESVIIHDAFLSEEPRRSGFGEKEFADYIKSHPQDIIIIFNDMAVTSMLIKDISEKLTIDERKSFKLLSYMDQVYPYQKPDYINMLNQQVDGVIVFTPYWEEVVRKLGLSQKIPTYVFPHGFDNLLYFPIPINIARLYYEIPEDAFIVLNLNRNQPRKRWDHTLMAFANVVERHYKLTRSEPNVRPIKLMIGTIIDGFWNLIEIFQNEVKKRGVPIDEAMKYIMSVPNPQKMSDRDINIIYNACDIGINTCDGEGFGLCQFEHLAVGKPQIVGNVGGFKEYLHSDNSIIVQPKWSYYLDKSVNSIGGYAEVSDPNDFADAIWNYYKSPEKAAQHGKVGRAEILQKYKWADMNARLYDIIHKTIESTRTPPSL